MVLVRLIQNFNQNVCESEREKIKEQKEISRLINKIIII
jgi:hypothetical protein